MANVKPFSNECVTRFQIIFFLSGLNGPDRPKMPFFPFKSLGEFCALAMAQAQAQALVQSFDKFRHLNFKLSHILLQLE